MTDKKVVSMTDTDKLIAAIFAATMTAKEAAPGPHTFLDFYDACVTEILQREAVDTAQKAERKRDAQEKAWG